MQDYLKERIVLINSIKYITEVLEKSNAEYAFTKGAMLAILDKNNFRHCDDVDVIVGKKDLKKLKKIMVFRGFSVLEINKNSFCAYDSQMNFDFHSGFEDAPNPFRFSDFEMSQCYRFKSYSLVRPELEFIHIAIHSGFHHGFYNEKIAIADLEKIVICLNIDFKKLLDVSIMTRTLEFVFYFLNQLKVSKKIKSDFFVHMNKDRYDRILMIRKRLFKIKSSVKRSKLSQLYFNGFSNRARIIIDSLFPAPGRMQITINKNGKYDVFKLIFRYAARPFYLAARIMKIR